MFLVQNLFACKLGTYGIAFCTLVHCVKTCLCLWQGYSGKLGGGSSAAADNDNTALTSTHRYSGMLLLELASTTQLLLCVFTDHLHLHLQFFVLELKLVLCVEEGALSLCVSDVWLCLDDMH
jgi:hypothetical protein